MRHSKAKRSSVHRLAISALIFLAGVLPVCATGLQPETLAAFNHHGRLTQAAFDSENKQLIQFLWIERLPAEKRRAAYAQLRRGDVVIDRLETLDAGKPIPVPDGIIHHWIGTIFIPGATLPQVLAFEQDYDHQQQYFAPDVVRSKLLSQKGDDYTVEIRFREKKVITVVLDTIHQAHYAEIDATHAWSSSRTTRIQQVDHPGEAGELLEPEGHDGGFLWRMNTYWRFEQKNGGTYVESQSISLTRDIPTGLGMVDRTLRDDRPARVALIHARRHTKSNPAEDPNRRKEWREEICSLKIRRLEAGCPEVNVFEASGIRAGDEIRGAR